MKKLFAFLPCAHRFNTDKVSDLNIPEAAILCTRCGKAFGELRRPSRWKRFLGKQAQFHYLVNEGMHTIVFRKPTR